MKINIICNPIYAAYIHTNIVTSAYYRYGSSRVFLKVAFGGRKTRMSFHGVLLGLNVKSLEDQTRPYYLDR